MSLTKLNIGVVAALTMATSAAQSAVEVYKLSTPAGSYVSLAINNSVAQSTTVETYADAVNGVTKSATSENTIAAAHAFGPFTVALNAANEVIVCKENGQWIPKRAAFQIGPFPQSVGFPSLTRHLSGSLALTADGQVTVVNNIVDRNPNVTPGGELRGRYLTRDISFSLNSVPASGVPTQTAVDYAGPALAFDVPTLRSVSTQNISSMQYSGVTSMSLTLTPDSVSTGAAGQIPPSCQTSFTKAVAPSGSGAVVGSPPPPVVNPNPGNGSVQEPPVDPNVPVSGPPDVSAPPANTDDTPPVINTPDSQPNNGEGSGTPAAPSAGTNTGEAATTQGGDSASGGALESLTLLLLTVAGAFRVRRRANNSK